MTRSSIPILCLVLTTACASSSANAETYPVSGRWTYEDASGKGRAATCGKRYMEFSGDRRLDHGGAVPDYRNRGWTRSGDTYRLVDDFFNGQARGKAEYQLQTVDDDHIRYTMAGKSSLLRRC